MTCNDCRVFRVIFSFINVVNFGLDIEKNR